MRRRKKITQKFVFPREIYIPTFYFFFFFFFIVHSRPYYCVFYNTTFRRLGICLLCFFFFVYLNFLDLFFRVPAGVNFPSVFFTSIYIYTNFCDYFISQAFFHILPRVTRTFFSSSNQWWKRLSIALRDVGMGKIALRERSFLPPLPFCKKKRFFPPSFM